MLWWFQSFYLVLACIIFIVILIKLFFCRNLIFLFDLLCLPSYVVDIISKLLHSTFRLFDSTIIFAMFIILHQFCLLLEIFLNLVLDLLNIILQFIFDLVYGHFWIRMRTHRFGHQHNLIKICIEFTECLGYYDFDYTVASWQRGDVEKLFAIFLLQMELRPCDELWLLVLCDFNFDGFRISGIVMPTEESHGCDMRVLNFDFFQTNDEILR